MRPRVGLALPLAVAALLLLQSTASHAANSSFCPGQPTKKWLPIATEGGPGLLGGIADPQSFPLGNDIFMFWTESEFLDKSAVFSICENKWRPSGFPAEWLKQKWDPLHVVRKVGDSLVFYGRAWRIDGPQQETFFRIFIYSAKSKKWEKFESNDAPAKEVDFVADNDHHIVMWSHRLKSGHFFDLDTHTWHDIPSEGAPETSSYSRSLLVEHRWYLITRRAWASFDLSTGKWTTLNSVDTSAEDKANAPYQINATCELIQAGNKIIASVAREYTTEYKRWELDLTTHKVSPLSQNDFEKLSKAQEKPLAESPKIPAPPAKPYTQARTSNYAFAWGKGETRTGNDCMNPFVGVVHAPHMPICTPSHPVDFTRYHAGGFRYFLK